MQICPDCFEDMIYVPDVPMFKCESCGHEDRNWKHVEPTDDEGKVYIV